MATTTSAEFSADLRNNLSLQRLYILVAPCPLYPIERAEAESEEREVAAVIYLDPSSCPVPVLTEAGVGRRHR